MAALAPGKKAPAISLTTLDGKKLTLAEALHKGPVLLAFFKVSCPTCQFTLPYLQRIFEAYPKGSLAFWGVSQNDRDDTIDFCQHFGVTFPVLLDDKRFTVSSAYGLTHVPSLFLVRTDGAIELTSVGFTKTDVESLAEKASQAANLPLVPPFRPGEVIPAFKHG
ncbi:MAG TPA: TlpA disulfide reductase family protein [Verrucomicrobiae bacterium]|nr:TlpA disulfide reductase family protein [Verrucomicrobiae bacterium]